MKNSAAAGLLPVGMTDVLPPFASFEADAVAKVMNVFQGCSYQRVSPPFLEFEETLLSDKHADLSRQTFRVMDAVSEKMMGVRADITPQISRIAVTRLKEEPRPLRLAYAEHVLRVSGNLQNPARQILQVGAEMFGADSVKADAEIILMAAEALETLGIKDFSFDLNLPTLLPAMCSAVKLDKEERDALSAFLNQKDFSSAKDVLKNAGKKARDAMPLFETLFQSYGDCGRVLDVLRSLDHLPEEAAAECHRLIDVVALLKKEKPGLSLTIDVLENRGFEYHCGIAFSIFSKQAEVELGRGGRYIASLEGCSPEPAVGVTLFMAHLIDVLGELKVEKRVYVPFDVSFTKANALRAKGYVIVCGLKSGERDEARRMLCDYIYADGQIRPL